MVSECTSVASGASWDSVSGFGVKGLGFRVWGLGFRAKYCRLFSTTSLGVLGLHFKDKFLPG